MDVRRWLGVALLALLAACSSSDSDGADGTVATTAPVTVEAVLERAAAAMAEVDFVAFEIERSGAEVAIDPAGQLGFDAAQGHYAAPSSAEAVLEVTALGLRTRVGAVAIGGSVWITNPLTGRWEAAPEGLSFDPAVLFDERTGWPALLTDGLQDPEVVGGSPDGEGRHHVRGTLDAERVATLTGGLAEQPTRAELWIDAESGHIDECRFDVETDDGVSSWVLRLSDYGEPVTIEQPEPGSTS